MAIDIPSLRSRSDIASLVLVSSGINRIYATYLAGVGFAVLAYHEVRATDLEAHLRALAPYFRFMSLEEALAYHCPPRSRPPLVLTFDDGYSSWLSDVLPVLRKRRTPALFFLCPSFLDGTTLPWYEIVERYLVTRRAPQISLDSQTFETRSLLRRAHLRRTFYKMLKSLPPTALSRFISDLDRQLTDDDRRSIRDRYLTWSQLEELNGFDWEVGAHSLTHPILRRLEPQQLTQEIRGSKYRLESVLRRPVRYFAYPNGAADDFDDRVVAEVERAGFSAAFTALPGRNEPGDDPFRIRRCVIPARTSIARLHASTSGLLGLLQDAWNSYHGSP